jgi:hypothetical protein
VSEKLPYWKHPNYDPSEDPASGFSQWQMLEPITTELSYAVISECICSVQPDKHDPDFLDYKLGADSIEKFPSVCATKDYAEPGELILSVFEEDNLERLSASIRKVRAGVYLLSYSWQSNEPPYDSGEDAAWEGGNVDFNFKEFTEADRIEFESRLKDESDAIFEQDLMYETIPLKPPCRDAILIKSEASMLSEVLYLFLESRFERVSRLLSACLINGALPDHLKVGEWLEFSIHGDLDKALFNALESCYEAQNQKG